MNSFTLIAIGHLVADPERLTKGETKYSRFCLIANDVGATTKLWFVAFGSLGESIATHARKGDQLMVHAHARGRFWTDKRGQKRYEHSFVAQGFRFGAPGRAKRAEFAARGGDEPACSPAS